MKLNRFFLFTLPALLIGMTACSSDNDDDNNGGSGPDSAATIVGDWYEEAENEEMRYGVSGTFYDRYTNTKMCNETEGRYEYDSSAKRLTQSYTFLGQSQINDWKVRRLDAYQLVIYNETAGEHTCERIAATYTLNVGNSTSITLPSVYSDCHVYSYETKNGKLASVSQDGTITATGEKGTTYIKLNTNNGVLWVRVSVGDDSLDLWYNYHSLIGKDVAYMKSTLGNPSINGSDGYSYGYRLQYHNYVDEVDVFFDKNTGLVDEIAMSLRVSAPESSILSYLNSHYYPNIENYWTTSNTVENSTAIVYYDKTNKVVRFFDAAEMTKASEFPDYTYTFGYTMSQLTNKFGKPLYQDFPQFIISDNDYVESIYFYMDKTTQKATAFVLTLKSTVKESDIKNLLSKKYKLYASSDGKYGFCDGKDLSSSKVSAVYDSKEFTVTFFDRVNFKSSSKQNDTSLNLFLDD